MRRSVVADNDRTLSQHRGYSDSHLLSQWVALTDNVYNQPI